MAATSERLAKQAKSLYQPQRIKGNEMLGTILIMLFVLLLIGAIPTWPHSRNWGYGPSGGFGLAVVILIVLLLAGRLPF